MRPGLQTSFRLSVSNPAPQRERGGAQQELLQFVESTRELLRYLRNYKQIVPQTYGAECKGQKSRGFYPQGNESKTEPSS